MLKSTLYKSGTMIVSAITFAFAGFAGQALAATGTISETGPDSHNSVKIENTNKCEVTNNNNVSANNNVRQNATSGDVDVSRNTNAGGWNSGWNDWNPHTWQAHGYTYDQWHAAFMTYMHNNEGDMRSNWGHMTGGGASSGDATNSNSTSTNISIHNGAPSGGACSGDSDTDNEGSIDTTGPDSHNGVVLGSSNTSKTKNNNNVSANNKTGQNATSGKSSGFGNTNGGSGGSGAAGNGSTNGTGVNVGNGGGTTPHDPATGSGSNASISNTGPDSINKILVETTNMTSVVNNNNVAVNNWVNQSATSGDVNVSHNTTAGGAGSGSAGNSNGTDTGVGVSN